MHQSARSTCHLTLTEKWWLDSMEAGSPPMPGCCVCTPWITQHGLTAGFASCLKDARDSRYVRHQIRELLTQRSFQIVAGYEDCNDADSLRSDPIFKTVCDRLPESDPDLASQPTLSRLENSVDSKDLTRLGQWLLETYLKHRKKSRPEKIILDIDSTDDVTHGQQEFSFYHGYYREHMYHPLLLFDGETGDLVCALLRPGNQGAAAHAVAVLKRVVARMRPGSGIRCSDRSASRQWLCDAGTVRVL